MKFCFEKPFLYSVVLVQQMLHGFNVSTLHLKKEEKLADLLFKQPPI
uniref:Uncharacterized protein n=1 Tax=Anguilla anguilla TaxID=7936 RepID=A0A0E9R629_ANGAN